jgi:hypothetical protein
MNRKLINGKLEIGKHPGSGFRYFTDAEEDYLAELVDAEAQCGFGWGKDEVINLAFEYATATPRLYCFNELYCFNVLMF